MLRTTLWLVALLVLISGCKMTGDDDMTNTNARLRFQFKFDPDQERLNGLGQPAAIPPGNGTLTPDFSTMSAHFIELVPTALTPYQSGAFVYKGSEVPADNPNSFGFTTAIDFDKAKVAEEGEVFLEVPIEEITPGTYQHIRVSVSYQNYSVKFNLNDIPGTADLSDQTGTVASFVGYNTHINNLKVYSEEIVVNDTKLQGFWAFETQFSDPFATFNQVVSGQAPENATTVVNPFPEAPIPLGSCVVSGSFAEALVITGEEREDITITLSFSINESFEWKDLDGNGKWDLNAQTPANSEPVVDMGLRGLKAFVE